MTATYTTAVRALWAALVLLGIWATAAPARVQPEEDKTGVVVGVALNKGGNWIEVKAFGEEKERKYYTGSDPVALKAVKATEFGSRVRLHWRYREVFRVVKIEVLQAPEKD